LVVSKEYRMGIIGTFGQRRIEHALCDISAKIATVIELSQNAKQPAQDAQFLLIRAQQELEDLYLSLENQEEENAS